MPEENLTFFHEAAILYALYEHEKVGGKGLTEEEIYSKVSTLSVEDEVEVAKIAAHLKEEFGEDNRN